MNLPRYFFSKPGRMLLIGLGAGSLAKDYTHERWSVDAVEIDEDVVDVARRYFNLQPEDANTRVMDGRQFLATSQDTYDVILLDAFGSSSIPFHLVTVEAFGLVADRLSDNGLFAINVETQGWDDPIIRWIAATLRIHFDHVLALPMAEPPDRLGNVILLASRRALQPEREPERNETLDPNWRYGLEYARIHAWDNRFEPDVGDVEPLTDDLNRSDLRAEEINMIARKELHLYFGESGGSW
jgi:spermidine synthase